MTAPNRQVYTNNGTTTLNGTINATTDTVVVANGGAFPSTGNFPVICESEIMLCTAISGDTLTVQRAQDGTTGASHTDGTTIYLPLSGESWTRIIKDNLPAARYKLPLGRIMADDGRTALATTDFTWVNQGNSTITATDQSMLLRVPTSSGVNLRALTRTAPSTPYAYIGAFRLCLPRAGSDDVGFGLFGFRSNVDSKLQMFVFGSNGEYTLHLGVQNYTDETTFLSTTRPVEACVQFARDIWLRIEDNGTNLIYSVGMDGKNWIQVDSNGRTGHMAAGPTQVFWGGANNNNTGCEGFVQLLHWSKE